MTAKRKFKSDVFESIHASAAALLRVGAIDKATMREFDESCLVAPPAVNAGNREALDSSNAYVEQNGLPLARHRSF